MATTVVMPLSAGATPTDGADAAALGARAALDAVVGGAARFRLEFAHDVRTKELRWVLFTCTFSVGESARGNSLH